MIRLFGAIEVSFVRVFGTIGLVMALCRTTLRLVVLPTWTILCWAAKLA